MELSLIYRVAQCSLNSKIVIASAFFYCFAFFGLETFFWCIIPALFLLFFVLYRNISLRYAWRLGLSWGMLVYGFQCGLMFYSLYLIKQHYIIIFLWLLTTLYLSVYVMILFLTVAYLQKKVCFLSSLYVLPIIARCGFIIVSVSIYFWLIDNHAFFIFGVEGGYCLASPCIPLAQLIDTSRGKISHVLGIVRTEYKPCKDVNPVLCVHTFFKQIAYERNKNKNIRCIITPESALPFALNRYPKLLKIFCDYSQGISLLVGSFYKHEDTLYGCFYFFSEGVLQELYIKQHAMPLTEMIPHWLNTSFLRALFLTQETIQDEEFLKKNSVRKVCMISNECGEDLLFYPIICSEFFCTRSLQTVSEAAIALILINDRWFASSLLIKAAYLYARFQAWWYKKKILYVSYFTCEYF